MLHGPVQWVVGVEVAHALEVYRLGPWLVNHNVLQISCRYAAFGLCYVVLSNLLWLLLRYGFNVWSNINFNVVGDIGHVCVVHDGGNVQWGSAIM